MSQRIELIDLSPRRASFKSEVLSGLRKPRKELQAKFFYDKQGSELFERITRLPEYYLTRTEIGILDDNADEMVSMMGKNFVLIEFGSGSSRKVRILLDQMLSGATYMPIDISLLYLKESAAALTDDYPHVEVIAVCADYTMPFEMPSDSRFDRRVIFFPGSTVGNFERELARIFFRDTALKLKSGDGMIIGVDLQKDDAVLDAAYNDQEGVTSEFNKNILVRINRELNATFDLGLFDHYAFYNRPEGRIEMHLKSRIAQQVSIDGETIDFREGETIHTENSYKYTIEGFHELIAESGFVPMKVWTDAEGLFSVHYLRVA
ncbi:MAG TPA: L-histidine N(alpha)-methyltransferase [Thermoanaerobaculia bacterium]|nr:L-histidine N(alpha)-methyltransferase [Thermoanaerobaculia bacterium]